MQGIVFVALTVLCCGLYSEAYRANSFKLKAAHEENKVDLMKLMEIIGKSRIPERYLERKTLAEREPVLSGFSWSDCGTSDDLAKVTSLQISPDPIRIPGNVTVQFDGTLKKDVTSPLKVELTLQKKVFIWVTVPCVDEMGSCTYDDVCDLIPQDMCDQLAKYGFPCKCPVKAGDYQLPQTSFSIQKDLPSIASGDFKARVEASSNGAPVACIDLEFSLD